MYRSLESYAFSIKDEIVSHRRFLHRIPETAWNEYQTQAYILSQLKKLDLDITEGIPVTGHDTGIIAQISCGKGPVIALRFDMDALPVEESSDADHYPAACSFRSEHPGCMHACGHDGHIAIGLAAAKIICNFRDRFSGTVRLIFQPAEEGCRGARTITANHWLDDADYFMAGHIVGREYCGGESSDIVPGVSASLATTKIDASFTGRSCHAAVPEKGINVMPAIASSILSLQNIPAPKSGKALVNIGTVHAGEGRNIVAGSGAIELETRGSTTALNRYMEENVLMELKHNADQYGCGLDLDILSRTPSVESSPELCDLAKSVCSRFDAIRSFRESAVFKASEDVSVMIERVRSHGGKGIFFLFTTDTTAPLHSFNYNFDEEILPRSAAFMSGMVFRLCSDYTKTSAK